MYEELFCSSCFDYWVRPLVRGRKPSTCPRCRPARPTPVRAPKAPTGVLELTDGDRPSSYLNERNDCTVRALAVATGKGYAAAHQFMSRNGRKPGRGAQFARILRANKHEVLGTRLQPISLVEAKGLRTAILRNPQLRTGTWILQMRAHVVTLKDGKLYDSFDSSRKVVRSAWRVLED